MIADDHALFRRGLEMVLAEEDDIDVVGQASDGAEAVTVAGESLPDVVLMDIRMPFVDGIEAGIVRINAATAGGEPHVPFGGSKGSGYGPREQGRAARDFYTETVTVYQNP